MVLRMYTLSLGFISSCFLFYILQWWFRNVKAFEKTIEFFHDVLQRNITAANPPPPNKHDVSHGKNRYVRLPLAKGIAHSHINYWKNRPSSIGCPIFMKHFDWELTLNVEHYWQFDKILTLYKIYIHCVIHYKPTGQGRGLPPPPKKKTTLEHHGNLGRLNMFNSGYFIAILQKSLGKLSTALIHIQTEGLNYHHIKYT